MNKEENLIDTHIALNQTVNKLYNNLDAKDKIINEQTLEIARLKEEVHINEQIIEVCIKRMYKAIELLKNDYFEDGSGNNIDKVLEILGDKENRGDKE